MCIVCFEFWSLDVVVAGTDEFSGFSLFVGLNCSDLSFVYQHSGPVIPSSRVSLTFQANAPKVARCIGYRNNRTINSVPPGYSTDAKADICNLEVLGETCTRIIRGSVNHILCWDKSEKNQMTFLLIFHWLTKPSYEFCTSLNWRLFTLLHMLILFYFFNQIFYSLMWKNVINYLQIVFVCRLSSRILRQWLFLSLSVCLWRHV